MKARTGLTVAAFAMACFAASPSRAADDCAGKPSANTLVVQVSGLRSAKGEVAVTLYPDNPRRFLAPGGKLLRQRVKTQTPVTRACFFLPDAGVYAVAVYHDANADQDFNRNPVGMPTEGFGFSNDAPATLGLPAFKAVRFRAKAGASSIAVRMHYAG